MSSFVDSFRFLGVTLICQSFPSLINIYVNVHSKPQVFGLFGSIFPVSEASKTKQQINTFLSLLLLGEC